MANVKGNALIGLKQFVVGHYGSHGVERWLEALPAAEQALVHGILLPSGWYPIGMWNRLVDGYVQLFGRGDAASFRSVAEQIAKNDLTMVFKVLLKMASPSMIVRRAPSLWERYFDVGRIDVEERAKAAFVLSLTAPTSAEEAPGPVTCGTGVCAWVQRAVALAGAESAHVHETRCRLHGAPACQFAVTWRA